MMQRGMGLKTSVQRKLHKQEKMFIPLLSFLTQEDFLHLSGVAPEVADAHHDKTTLLVGAEGMHEDLSCCFLGEDMANKRPSSEPARQQSKSYAGAHVAFHVAYFPMYFMQHGTAWHWCVLHGSQGLWELILLGKGDMLHLERSKTLRSAFDQ